MRREKRALAIALTTALTLSVVLAPPAAAAERSHTTYYDPGGRPWITIGPWGGNAYFNVRYQVVDVGLSWDFDRFETDGVAQGGRTCQNFGWCVSWSLGSQVQFLNASGGIVATMYPPYGSCYTITISQADRLVSKCSYSGYTVSRAANRIRFAFNLYVVRYDGFVFAWPTVYKTVYIL